MIKPTKKLTMIKKENAQTMVEFAIVFPILLLITYGLIEFGRMMFIYSEVYGAAREGARYGATALNDTNCDGILKATTRLLFLIPANAIYVDIDYDHGLKLSDPPDLCSHANNSYSGPADGLALGDRTVVEVDVNYQPLLGSFLGFQGFHIKTTNYRTLLTDVPIASP